MAAGESAVNSTLRSTSIYAAVDGNFEDDTVYRTFAIQSFHFILR
jgi:hypothetical protein